MSEITPERIAELRREYGEGHAPSRVTNALLDAIEAKEQSSVRKSALDEANAIIAAKDAEILRLRRLMRLGFDDQRVLQWLRSESRQNASTAFTSGGERAAAQLCEMAEDRLRTEAEAARKDAERLDWLESKGSLQIDCVWRALKYGDEYSDGWSIVSNDGVTPCKRTLREAIDKARSVSQGSFPTVE